ncbi:MAG: hypothetical protein JO041_06070 [Acidobacteria bacterium]|nr:hypothetical protein [Acidobacteriota bacterium]
MLPVRLACTALVLLSSSLDPQQIAANKAGDALILPSATPAQATLSVSQRTLQNHLVHLVKPVFPAGTANQGGGFILLRATLGRDGRIVRVEPISGPAELLPAAAAALERWRYLPWKVNGVPAEVETVIAMSTFQ